MPKRQSTSLDDDLSRLHKKIKKLEKRIRVFNTSSDQPGPSLPDPDPDEAEYEILAPAASPAVELYHDAASPTPAPDPCESCDSDEAENEEPPLPSGEEAVPLRLNDSTEVSDKTAAEQSSNCLPPETSAPGEKDGKSSMDLDDDILAILGDDPSSKNKYGPDIRKELASRLQHIATEGLSKENRKELLDKYLLPANCLHVGAPTVNPEIKAALQENVAKRDKGIETKQKEMSSAIACLTEIISIYLQSKEKNNEVLQKLMDVGRILCDIQHGDSVTRRNFILFAVKYDMQEHLKSTKIDTLLFGENLSETLKSAKAVNKSGAELKVDSNKIIPKKAKPPATQGLNRKAAPPRRPPGAQAPRSREPAHPRAPAPAPPDQRMTARAPAYRTSSTQPPPASRTRRY